MIKDHPDKINSLIREFRRGREQSFDEIATVVHQDILNIAYRYLQNYEDAKDVLQIVLVKIYRHLRSFRGAAKFSSWIYRVTVNSCVDFIRKNSRETGVKHKYKDEKTRYRESGDAIETREKQRILKKAILSLPRQQRGVFILRHYRGLKIKEISRALGCSQSTVKTHLSRAVSVLKGDIQSNKGEAK